MPFQIHEDIHPHLAPMPDSRGRFHSPMDRKYSARSRVPASLAIVGSVVAPAVATGIVYGIVSEVTTPLPSVARQEQEIAEKQRMRELLNANNNDNESTSHVATSQPEFQALPETSSVIPLEGYPIINGTDIALSKSVVVDLTAQYPPDNALTWRLRIPGIPEEQVITSSTNGGITASGPVWIEDPDGNPVYHMTVLPKGKTTTADVTFEANNIKGNAPIAKDGYSVRRGFIHLEANPIDGERYYYENPNLQDEMKQVKERMEAVWDVYFRDLPSEKRPKIYVPSTNRGVNTADGFIILSPDLLKTSLWMQELDFKAIEYLGKYAASEIGQTNTAFGDSWKRFNETYQVYAERFGTTIRRYRASPFDPGTPTFAEHMLNASTFEPQLARAIDETPIVIEGGRKIPPPERVPAGLFVSVAYNPNKVIEHFGYLSSEEEQYSDKKTPEKQLYRELVFAGLDPLYQLVGEQRFLEDLSRLRDVQQAIGMSYGLGFAAVSSPESITKPSASSIPTN